jgi:hypothetical protein
LPWAVVTYAYDGGIRIPPSCGKLDRTRKGLGECLRELFLLLS